MQTIMGRAVVSAVYRHCLLSEREPERDIEKQTCQNADCCVLTCGIQMTLLACTPVLLLDRLLNCGAAGAEYNERDTDNQDNRDGNNNPDQPRVEV